MKQFKLYGLLIALLSSMLFVTSCSNDDEDVDINTYIKGKWYSYKASVSDKNGTTDADISKTGKLSLVYYEFLFKEDNIVDFSYYKDDVNKMSKWVTETLQYSIKGDVVTLYDSSGSMDLFFNENERSLYLRIAGDSSNGDYKTIFIYLRK
jgi:hypothetical protein